MQSNPPRPPRSAARRFTVPALLTALPALLLAQRTPEPAAEPPAPTTAAKPVPVAKSAPTVPQEEELFELSPFEVKADTRGYFSANAMSGTRLGSKIEDLGQSVTVMTKEQMSDFAMLDINDIFDHMAGAEGTNTFSDFVIDRTGAVTDNVSLDPNNANRVRGIGNANVAFNNIATTGRVPVDPLWMDSLELSRGPNASIFGLGNSSGTVNQVPSTAHLTRNFVKSEVRADTYGGWRSSLDANHHFLRNKVALRASYAYQHTGFTRKPAGEDAKRYSVQLKVQPVKISTLSLSWYRYTNASQRPNYTTPRDNVSSWIAAGRPAWDPVTRLITINGVKYGQGSGGVLSATSTTPITTLPSYFNGSPTDGRSLLRIGDINEASYWTTPTVTSATTPLTAVNNNIRFVSTSPVNSYGAAQPLFASYAAISDKSIYDYEKINLNAANKAWDDTQIFLAQFDQVFYNSSRQTLAARGSYMVEDSSRLEDLPLGPASVNGVVGELYIDPNTRNLDGTPNPYYGRPYLRSKEPFLRDRPMRWATAQVQLAYRLDFSRNEGFSKWLGSHQLLGYYENKDQESRQYAWRRTSASRDQAWQASQLAAGIPPANRTTTGTRYPASNNALRVYEQYYIGNTPGGNVEYGPNRFENATLPFVWGNTGAFTYTPAKLTWTPSPDGSASNAAREIIIKTSGALIQSNFLNDKLVTTFGLREDEVYDRNAPAALLTPDLLDYDYATSNQWNPSWRLAKGKTKSASIVGRPFKDFKYLRGQAESGSGVGRFVGQFLTGMSLSYNVSDNFIAQGPAFDLFLRRLPNQTGKSNDVGVGLTMFDNKLSIIYKHYKTDQRNKRDGDIATIAQRVLRYDGLNAADAWALQDRARDWITQLNPSFTATQVDAEIAKVMGLSQEQISGLESAIAAGTVVATQDVVSKGHELEVNYNPTRSWTVSASASKSESINQNAGSMIEDWIAQRMPIWTTVEDPRFPDPNRPGRNLLWWNISGSAFTTFGYNGTNSAATNYVTFVEGPLAVYRQTEGRPRPQMPKYTAKFSTRYNFSGLTDHKILKNFTIGGSVRWTDRKAIGFLGVQSLPAKITALDVNKPVFSDAETYLDLFISYRTKMFGDKVRANFQINAKNITEPGGRLIATQVFPDGTPLAYRIIDPRQFVFTASFEL